MLARWLANRVALAPDITAHGALWRVANKNTLAAGIVAAIHADIGFGFSHTLMPHNTRLCVSSAE